MKPNYIFIFPIIICAASAATANGQSAFSSIIQTAIGNDKGIKAQQAAGEAAVTFSEIAGPEVDFEHLWPSGGAEPDVKWNIGVSQEFDWPGIYGARSKVASLERDNASLVLMQIRADKALSVKQVIIDIINSHRRHELYSAVARNLARIDSLTQVAFDRGAATSLDIWKMKLAVLENQHSIATAESDIRALEGSLRALGVEFINGEAEFWHDYPIQPLINPANDPQNSLAEAIISNTARLGAAKAKAIRMEAAPGFSVGFIHAFEENTHFNGFSVGLRLPSYTQKKKNKAARLEAEAASLAASFEADKQVSEMQSAYEEALTLSRALASYRDLTGDESYLRLLDKSFNAGQLNIIDYLNEINLFISARIGYLDLEYRYNLALAKLNRYRSLDFQ